MFETVAEIPSETSFFSRIGGCFRVFLCCLALSLYAVIGINLFPYLLDTTVSNYVLYQNSSLDFISLGFRIDQLSAFFAVLIVTISTFITIYLIKYAEEYRGKYSLTKLSLATHIFSLSMIGVVLANHVFTFLFFWELMSLSSYLLVIYDHKKKENINAGFIYFLMTHIATAFLLVAFLLLSGNTHNLGFSNFYAAELDSQITAIVFIMFLLGSGIKAGLIPFHFWLPVAHPAAPSHVSALMSALMVKTPIYLLIRVIFNFLHPEIYMGYSILALGLASALLGIIYALKERDIKKLLAYSTIENVGIIFVALALSIIFYVLGNGFLASLALVASLFHILNHAVYKSALFMGAGSIAFATHTKDLNRLGGLIKHMPRTAVFFLIPVMSIMALPFSNGFVSEWLIYQSLIRGMQIDFVTLPFILPLTLLLVAMVAGLAFVTFSKLFATAFLAYPRSSSAKAVEEVHILMWLPIALFSGICIFLGVKPQILSPVWIKILTCLDMSIPEGLPYFSWSSDVSSSVSETPVFPTEALLVVLLLMLVVFIIFNDIFRTQYRKAIPWACGYEVGHRAQYNSNSFSQSSLRLMSNFYHIDFANFFNRVYAIFHKFSKDFRDRIQSGDLHLYLLYILIAIIGGLIYAKSF